MTYEEAKDFVEWTLACVDEIDSINKTNTWTLVDKPGRVKVIGLMWVFKETQMVPSTSLMQN